MAVSDVPYDTVARAKRFKTRMSKPWMVKVTKENGKGFTFYRCDYPDWNLIGGDSLLDGMYATADRVKKNFDLRPVIKRDLRTFIDLADPVGKKAPLEAINIVRETVGLIPFDPKKVPAMNAPIDFLKEKGIAVRDYEVYKIDGMHSWFRREYGVEKYAGRKNLYVYVVSLESVKDINSLTRTLKERFEVLDVIKRTAGKLAPRNIVIRIK